MNYLVIQQTRSATVVARFQQRRGSLLFTGGARCSNDEPTPLPELLAKIGPVNREQDRVILCLKPDSLFLREVELPIADRRKLRDVLPLELKGETALDTDELIFDGIPLSEGKALAIWARRRDVAEQIRLHAEAGVEPEFVTAPLCHWGNLIPASAGVTAITDGEALTVYRNAAPFYFRPLHSDDEGGLTRTLAAVELGREVTVERLLLHGAAAKGWQKVEGVTASPLPIHSEMYEAFTGDEEAARDLAGAYAAVRACMTGEAVNFRTGELAYTTGREKLRRKLRLTLLLAVAAIIVFLAEAGLRHYLVKRDLASLNASIMSIYKEVFPGRKKPVDEVAELRSEIRRLGGGGAASGTLNALRLLADLKGEDVTGIYEAEITGGQVRLKGEARSVQAVNDFRARAAAQFAGAEVGEIKSRPDGSVTFLFRGTLKGERK
ncbi:type II secretion system protein GspL [Geobacter sp. DSM 9736]|uniref:type II secretion system protein GspL n=1 Tax=Geobacter sp. DSM 9736 TaxID=1277350 RepID=UPI000B4FF64D|nr:type II secretion system protein GspL [Geobacter sp. DSM 9736]SNB47413.1 general secretion pathway protein L [Geobacter sp. DSM 9736]